MLFFSPYLHARTAIKMFDGMNSLLILLLFVLKRIANMYKSNNITGELFLELDQWALSSVKGRKERKETAVIGWCQRDRGHTDDKRE